jgi:hypothetical protein
MMFIVRTLTGRVPTLDIKMQRRTPPTVPNSAGLTDFFCLGEPAAARSAGWSVLPVHDGWYADDQGGGVAIWGQGIFWEVRDTPFTIKQACGLEAWPASTTHDAEAVVNVRQTIFRG